MQYDNSFSTVSYHTSISYILYTTVYCSVWHSTNITIIIVFLIPILVLRHQIPSIERCE